MGKTDWLYCPLSCYWEIIWFERLSAKSKAVWVIPLFSVELWTQGIAQPSHTHTQYLHRPEADQMDWMAEIESQAAIRWSVGMSEECTGSLMLSRSSDEDAVETEDFCISLGTLLKSETVVVDNSSHCWEKKQCGLYHCMPFTIEEIPVCAVVLLL